MTASEFAFLALGLVLGVASGAALSMVIRARPPAPREVRVVVAQGAVPVRPPATLQALSAADPVEPADPVAPVAVASTGSRNGTPVLVPLGAAIDVAAHAARIPTTGRPTVGVPIHPEPDPLVGALGRSSRTVGMAVAAPTAVAVLERPDPDPDPADRIDPADPVVRSQAGGPPGSDALPVAGAVDACADERRIAQERCALAERLTEAATIAADRLRTAQREFDDHEARADRATTAADPRAARAAKEAALAAFRAADARAATREETEIAASDWLTEIDRLNRVARDAALEVARERGAALALLPALERLGLDADVARINAESAAEACLVAREALAACEEAETNRIAGPGPDGTDGDDERPEEGALARVVLVGGPDLEPGELAFDEDAPKRVFGDHEPAILKLLRGDRAAMTRIAAMLAGDDPDASRHWQLALAGLIDAIVARAIESAALEFPLDHPFWAPFSQVQCRDIAIALASFGYRFDGLGGFVDDRVPSQRDLSLAVGYAGLDPMRTRHWPKDQELVELYREVAVAADEFIASAAPDLTLGEMIALLRNRAEGLTDLWNAWGRVRPLLLQP